LQLIKTGLTKDRVGYFPQAKDQVAGDKAFIYRYLNNYFSHFRRDSIFYPVDIGGKVEGK